MVVETTSSVRENVIAFWVQVRNTTSPTYRGVCRTSALIPEKNRSTTSSKPARDRLPCKTARLLLLQAIPLILTPYCSPPQTHAYLDVAATLLGAPLACIFDTFGACPLAAFDALLAFSAFFLLSAAALFSFPSLIACVLAADRASGRIVLRSLMTSREAPTIAR